MKKLNKLQINSERIISDEELRKLNGGDCAGMGESYVCSVYYTWGERGTLEGCIPYGNPCDWVEQLSYVEYCWYCVPQP